MISGGGADEIPAHTDWYAIDELQGAWHTYNLILFFPVLYFKNIREKNLNFNAVKKAWNLIIF